MRPIYLKMPAKVKLLVRRTNDLGAARLWGARGRYYKLSDGVGAKVVFWSTAAKKEFGFLRKLSKTNLSPRPYCLKKVTYARRGAISEGYAIFMEHLSGSFAKVKDREVEELDRKLREAGVYHHDLSRGHNCIKTSDGVVKAFDFGLSEVVRGASLGRWRPRRRTSC